MTLLKGLRIETDALSLLVAKVAKYLFNQSEISTVPLLLNKFSTKTLG